MQTNFENNVDYTQRRKFRKLSISSTRNALALQKEDGSMPAGCNGPYNDPETPVRNTAHWCITFLFAWEQTGDECLREAAEKAIEYLRSKTARPESGAFYCRNNPNKDKTNGLIGQAWAIEALFEAGLRLDRADILSLAADVYRMHPYERTEGGWQRIHLDGTPAGFDRTFNHQLWFCAIGALLASAGMSEFKLNVRDFISRLPYHMKLYPGGLIRHSNASFLLERTKDKVIGVLRLLRNARQYRALYIKSIGYHAFNTYAFALIDHALPDAGIAEIDSVRQAVYYLLSDEYAELIHASPYGFPYNPPGIETAYTLDTFIPDSKQLADSWLECQLNETYNPSSGQLDLQSADPVTSAARLYEVCRLF